MKKVIETKVYAKHLKADISAKKVGPVMDLIRGRKLEDAKVSLAFDRSKAAGIVLIVLKSAEANAKTNHKLRTENLYVSEAWEGPATVQKKASFSARGRFSLQVSKKSNIYIGLAEAGK